MTGGAGIGATAGADAGVRPPAPGAEENHNKYPRPGQNSTSPTIFPTDRDKVDFSPAAHQLAQQSSGSTGTQTEETSSSTSGSAPNDTPAPQNARARNGNEGADASANNSVIESARPDETGEDNRSGSASPNTPTGISRSDMPAAEQQEVQELKQRDQEVRTHEAAHAAVGGQYAGAPTLEYQTGPDGKRYAVSGAVSIDLSKEKGNPQDTIAKMEQVQAAAMAPAQPSSQDRRVAARAAQIAAQARMDLRMEQSVTTASQAMSPFDIPAGGGEENEQNQPLRPSTPAVSIESLRWAGAVA
jgi:hypothetical protein